MFLKKSIVFKIHLIMLFEGTFVVVTVRSS